MESKLLKNDRTRVFCLAQKLLTLQLWLIKVEILKFSIKHNF
jgi:hypothetical protein